MAWRCFSVNGPGALEPIEGMMNSKTYLPIIKKEYQENWQTFILKSFFNKTLPQVARPRLLQIVSKSENGSDGMAW